MKRSGKFLFAALMLAVTVSLATVGQAAVSSSPAPSTAAIAADPSEYTPIAERQPVQLSAAEVAAQKAAGAAGLATHDGGNAPSPRSGDVTAAAATLPSGFSLETIAGGFKSLTKILPLADGRTLVATKAGVVWLIKNGAVQPTPVLDISGHVSTYGDRGLLSMAVSRTFATDHRLYLLYTYESNPAEPSNCKTGALSYVNFSTDVASGGETILVGSNRGSRCSFNTAGEPVGFTCGSATAQGCLASEYWSHSVGDMRFASDNTLYFTMGDGASYNATDIPRAYRAQNPDSLNGKVLHIDKDGRGLASNPFWDGNPLSNRSRVWSMGERNAFRMNLMGDQPYEGNVGWNTWEEINRAGKGWNSGWPCYEGGPTGTLREPRYQNNSTCIAQYATNPVVQAPVYAYNHNGASAAISGIAFYTGSAYPATYQGRAFYADYPTGVIGTLQLNAAGTGTTAQSIFATGLAAPVGIENGQDGNLLIADIAKGTVERLVYGAVTCGQDTWRASYWTNKAQTGTPALVRCEPKGSPALNQQWDSGGPISGVVNGFSARYECNCTFANAGYKFSLSSDDGSRAALDGRTLADIWYDHGTVTKDASVGVTAGTHLLKVDFYENTGLANLKLVIAQTAQPPTAKITAPVGGAQYNSGDTVNFAGTGASPAGGALPASSLFWEPVLRHCVGGACHSHPLATSTGASGSFAYPAHGTVAGECFFVQLTLTATDPASGSKGSDTINLYNRAQPTCP